MTLPIDEFESLLRESLETSTFVKLSLGNYQGTEEQLKNIYIREVLLKGERKLTFTYRYKTRDIVKNFNQNEGADLILSYLPRDFKAATLFTTLFDATIQFKNKGNAFFRKDKPSTKEKPIIVHDKQKKRAIVASSEKKYLHELNITDAAGNVYKNAQDKYKQINHYIELLRPLIDEVGGERIKNIVDMGSGKGYLTFALYDYLHQVLKLEQAHITGVEFRKDLVDLCNGIAQKAGFDLLTFKEGTIAEYEGGNIDLLIALHACDTATDDAISQGIRSGAKLIVVAPCCHKQIRRQMEQHKATNELEVLTKYGIFLERQAEMLTDGLRALILEYFGYKTKVLEFISDAHTPKNVLIVGVRTKEISSDRKEHIRQQIRQTKSYFGISRHQLESLLDI